MILKEPLEQAIWHALEYFNYHDAIFLAYRNLAEKKSEEAVWLLANCQFRAGQYLQAYHLLKSRGLKTTKCRFLFARTCYELEKFAECENALLHTASLQLGGANSENLLVGEFPECASNVFHLLGLVCSRTERSSKATDYFQKSLKLDPFQWSSYEKLCDLGEKLDASKVFSLTPELTRQINLHVFNAVNQNHGSQISSIGLANPAHEKTAPRPMLPPTPVTMTSAVQSPVMNLITNLTPSPATVTTTPCNQGFREMAASPCTAKPPTIPIKGRAGSKTGRNLLSTSTSVNLPMTPSFGIEPIAETPPQPNFVGPEEHGPELMFITPSPVQGIDPIGLQDPRAPSKKMMSRKGVAANTRSKPPVFSSNSVNSNFQSNPQQQSYVRRSSRLFASSNSVKENTKNSSNRISSPKNGKKGKISGNKVSRPNSTVSSSGENFAKPESQDLTTTTITTAVGGNFQSGQSLHLQTLQAKQTAMAEALLHLLQDLGNAYSALTTYECSKALQLLQQLPSHHYDTYWVLSLAGRAHFELEDYTKSIRAFAEAHRLSPHNLEGMEIYSSSLWHLQKEIALSTLAQELVSMDKKSPQSWCVAGNCFSLQKEHDVAIRFFQRAIQVDPAFTYAYTLLGHEYVLTEELDKAIACFRNAVRLDARHYNGWYGIGMIYYKQEKYSLAEVHFRKALSINPGSSVLMCHVGVVQHALQHSSLALATLEKAIHHDPQNPLCKFHKASILFSTDRHQEALKELEELRQLVPRESLVYFLMGKVNKKLGNTHLALMNFSWAMDLDPKGANNQIKEAIDKRYITDEDDPANQSSPGGSLTDDSVLPGRMSLSQSEAVGEDVTPMRNLQSPELRSGVFRYSLRDEAIDAVGAEDDDEAVERFLLNEEEEEDVISSVDLFHPRPGLDDTVGQAPAIGGINDDDVSPVVAPLDVMFSPSVASALDGVEEEMQLQTSESDESL